MSSIDSVKLRNKCKDYFSEIEFEMCTPSCKKSDMNERFLIRLNSARELTGIPFILNSAYRSSEWDKKKGRSGTGMHTLGRAVDIRCHDPFARADIIYAAMICGLNGIGVASNYIHLDDRDEPCFWLYDD